ETLYKSITRASLMGEPQASLWNSRTWNCAAMMAYGQREAIRSPSKTRPSRATGLEYLSAKVGLGKSLWARSLALVPQILAPVPHQRPTTVNKNRTHLPHDGAQHPSSDLLP